MNVPLADATMRHLLICLSYLVLISLASCAKADPPEEFVADPSIQNDYISSLPKSGSSGGVTYEIIQGFAVLEGDILLGRVNSAGQLSHGLRARGVGKSDAFSRWPDGIVVYEQTNEHSSEQQQNIDKAIDHWMEHTTLTFVERTTENADQYPHYIQFLDSRSCASHVGMIGGPQPIYVSNACSVGSIIHEIGHAVGLFHEHTRADRDNHIQIDWDEIVDGKDLNFNLQIANTDTYSEYDYGSIMHYGKDFFSKSGRPTIIVNDDIEIGQREALSPLDIESVNRMYATDLALGPLASSSNPGGLEIEVTTYNLGTLGAHQLELLMRFDDNSQWIGVSRDSGWNCLTYQAELKCTRDTLREQTESRFTVLADTSSTSTDNLSMLLVSRTQDTDPGNNSLNNDDVQWQSLGMNLRTESADDQTTEISQRDAQSLTASSAPALLAANLSATNTDTDIAKASAGSFGLFMLLLLLSITGMRRWHRLECCHVKRQLSVNHGISR